MSAQDFKQIYSNLNHQQKRAVDAIDGPVMVVAGPGTGKTQVLAARIANILLQTDTNPNEILALTFTESAAKNMQQRVVAMIGPEGYQVNINTFHGFCNHILQQYPEHFPITRESETLLELEKFQLVTNLIDSLNLEILKPLNDPLHYLKDIIKAISDLKREGVGVDKYHQIIDQQFANISDVKSKTSRARLVKDRDKNLELAQIYDQYQQYLNKNKKYDFDDMVNFVVAIFNQNQLLLREQQERLHYFLVDEYQDTNSAQNQVVQLLASYWQEQANIFVVGDPDQSIFRFQGASLENTLGFLDQYPNALVIRLDQGYRSLQPIYNAAHWLISQTSQEKNQFQANQPIISARKINFKKEQHLKKKNQPLLLFAAPSRMVEILFIGDQIKQLLAQGIEPSEIAVLYRNNHESFELMELLDKLGIRYEVAGGGNVLQTEPIRQLLELMQLIVDIREGQPYSNLFEVLTYEWLGLDRLLVFQLARIAGRKKISLDKLLENEFDLTEQKIAPLDLATVQQFYQKLIEAGLDDLQKTFPEWFAGMVRDFGYIDWLMNQPNRVELIINLNALFREVKALSRFRADFKLANFLEAINLMQEYRLSLDVEDLNIGQGAIQLSTVHKAKGREWQYVFVIGLNDRVWGNARKPVKIRLPEGLLAHTQVSKLEKNDEERRLFYVAITRAKDQCILSYPETIVTNQQTREVAPSQFISELKQDGKNKPEFKLEVASPTQLLDTATQRLATLFEPTSYQQFSSKERRFFQHLVDNFSLSVSSLNKYLKSPKDFLYDVLLRLPKAKEGSMAFGSAVHFALEWANKQSLNGQDFNVTQVIDQFERALRTEILTEKELSRRLRYGREIINKYFTSQYSSKKIVMAEQMFGFGEMATYLGDIHLTGKIDRVDWLDKNKRLVRVIDYKTGRPRSMNEIEGRTKSSNLSEREALLPDGIRGAYKRQLVFYKLLSELAPGFHYVAKEGRLEFVEPRKSNGKFVVRNIELTAEDLENMKELIKTVMKEIRSLSFLDLI